jgi:hypothetical protein
MEDSSRIILQTQVNHLREVIDTNAVFHKREHELINISMEEFKRTLDYRLAAMNQFREQINEERREYMRKHEYEHYQEVIAGRVGKLEKTQWIIAAGISSIMMIIQTLVHYIK